MADDTVDFVVAAWSEGGVWRTERLPKRSVTSVEMLVQTLGAHVGDGGVLGLVSIAEDYFLVAKVVGSKASVYLSDAAACVDSDLAAEILEYLELDEPDDDELDDVIPAGDELILQAWGVDADEFELLAGDPDQYPDEALSALATRLGFGEQFNAIVGAPLG
ncbi:MAG: tRNA adenosine deaminase-associated protein [Candidatus Nanopelagicales bacterium]